MTNGSLMKVPLEQKNFFWPALSDNWSWKTIFGLFENGCFTQVLLYYLSHFVRHECPFFSPQIIEGSSYNVNTFLN